MLLRRALVVAVVFEHLLLVIAPVDVLDPVDPWRIGRLVLGGHVPYADFALEYPPLAVLPFVIAALVPHAAASSVLALQAVVAEAVIALVVLRRHPGALLRWCVLSLLVFPFLSGGFDALAMASIALATEAMVAARPVHGWAAASAGALVKVVPATTWLWARRRPGVAVAALAVTGVLALGPMLIAPRPTDSWVGYALERGVQVESVPASVTVAARWATGHSNTYAYRFRSWEVDHADGAAAGLAVLGVAGLATIAVAAGRRGPADPWLATLAAVTVVVCANKLLSPQFVAWGAPAAAVLGGRWFRAYVGVAALTLLAYGVGNPPDGFLVWVGARNVLLVATAVAATAASWRRGSVGSTGKPARGS
jgi:hypothetical protein